MERNAEVFWAIIHSFGLPVNKYLSVTHHVAGAIKGRKQGQSTKQKNHPGLIVQACNPRHTRGWGGKFVSSRSAQIRNWVPVQPEQLSKILWARWLRWWRSLLPRLMAWFSLGDLYGGRREPVHKKLSSDLLTWAVPWMFPSTHPMHIQNKLKEN